MRGDLTDHEIDTLQSLAYGAGNRLKTLGDRLCENHGNELLTLETRWPGIRKLLLDLIATVDQAVEYGQEQPQQLPDPVCVSCKQSWSLADDTRGMRCDYCPDCIPF